MSHFNQYVLAATVPNKSHPINEAL